jgi:hypothetical protein
MKKKKYRIKEYIRANGSKYFRIQERFLLFWINFGSDCATYEDAQARILDLRAFEILESITHEVD